MEGKFVAASCQDAALAGRLRAQLILWRDNDAKFGTVFDDVAKGAGVRVIRTPVMAPKANSHCERLIGSVRRECLDHVLVLGADHLQRVLGQYRDYYNACRPHQGIDQRRPQAFERPARARRRLAGGSASTASGHRAVEERGPDDVRMGPLHDDRP